MTSNDFVISNLHAHTNVSDGTWSIEKYVLEAILQIVRGVLVQENPKDIYLGITDHDTCDAWMNLQFTQSPRLMHLVSGSGYTIIPVAISQKNPILTLVHGIELTTSLKDDFGNSEKIHIVGLGIDAPDYDHNCVQTKLDLVNVNRTVRLKQIVAEISTRRDGIYRGLDLDWSVVSRTIGPSKSPSRLHVGQTLFEQYPSRFKSARDANELAVNSDLSGYNFPETSLYDSSEGISIIESTLRGVSVIPHLDRLVSDVSKFGGEEKLVERLVRLGVSGIEIVNSNCLGYAERFDLIPVYGCDSHGAFDTAEKIKRCFKIVQPKSGLAYLMDEIDKKKN
ncbi:hypothetical protein HN587_03910 [Candidatus Woesearchaeota archaeon]|jgi:hypothetical protein|nr:hypothetical protein [Candidatus Woesearchaeota archaeon]